MQHNIDFSDINELIEETTYVIKREITPNDIEWLSDICMVFSELPHSAGGSTAMKCLLGTAERLRKCCGFGKWKDITTYKKKEWDYVCSAVHRFIVANGGCTQYKAVGPDHAISLCTTNKDIILSLVNEINNIGKGIPMSHQSEATTK